MTEVATAAGARQPRRRSELRRAEIERNASEMFAARGFHAARMEDIARASGITARALYRHYANKQALLARVVMQDQERVIGTLTELSEEPPGTRSFDARLSAVTDAALDIGALSLLWQREARHLDEQDYRQVRRRTRWMAERVEELLVTSDRDDLDADVSDTRSWVVISLISGHSLYESALSRARLSREIVGAVKRAVSAPLPTVGALPPVEGSRVPASRREQLVLAAAHAFRERGFAGVSMDEIGSQVGVVGPAMYRYFDSKAEVLAVAVSRLHEWHALELARVMRADCADSDVVRLLVRGYVRVALEATDLLATALTERLYLPDQLRERFDRIEADYLGEWQRWLLAARPALAEDRAITLAKAARTVIDDLVRIPHLRSLPILPKELETAALAVMGIGPEGA